MDNFEGQWEVENLALSADDYSSLTDVVYNKLKNAIVSQSVRPGTRISERDMAKKMNISTTTIKRALNKLSTEGLVEIRPRRGTYISGLSNISIEENSLIRAALEGVACRLAAKKATAEEIAGLRNQLKKMKRCTDTRDLGRLIETNTQFHMMIHDIGKNYYIKQLINVLRTFDASLRKRSLQDYQEASRGFNEHNGVFEAIASGDEALAEEKMKQHILRTSSQTRARLEPDFSQIAENANSRAGVPEMESHT